MAVTNGVLPVLILLGALRVSSLPEESFLPLSNPGEEDEMYLYMDQRSETDPKQSETRRRSTLDKNFARFGRADLRTMTIPETYDDYIPDEFNDRCMRMTRSGDKNDQFIRFGRGGSSDFVRFGRSDKGKNFIRFGRSGISHDGHARSKRQADYEKRGGTNFLRFGKNDSFMRFGREPETTTVTPSAGSPKQFVRNDLLIKMLLNLLRKVRDQSQSTTA